MLTRFTTVAGIWAVGALLLSWPHLSPAWRRRLAVVSSAAGLPALLLAVNTEGLRESPTVGMFLMGTPYVIEKASASASLPYYTLTGVCLLLGFIGLAAGDEVAGWLRERWRLSAIGLSLLVTAVRLVLEKVAAPASWTQAVGVTWLAPLVGAYFALNLRAEGKGWGSLLRALLVYAFAVRGTLALLMFVATTLRLGSHYDVSSMVLVRDPFTPRVYAFQAGSAEQLLYLSTLPQLVVWPVYTILSGLLGAGMVWLIDAARGRPRPSLPPLPSPGGIAPVGPD